MKKVVILVLSILVMVNIGCENKQIEPSNEPYIYVEEFGPNDFNPWESKMIYQDSEYKYFLGSYKKTYIQYKDRLYTYSEALEENIVTLDDLKKSGIQIYQKRCSNYKISDELRIYVEEIPPYEAQPAVVITIYDDSKTRYVVFSYKEAYVEYKGKQYDYSDALKENIVTLNDLANAGVQIYKTEIGSNKYEEYKVN